MEKLKNENLKNAFPNPQYPTNIQEFIVYTHMAFTNLVECSKSAKMDSFVIPLIYDEKPSKYPNINRVTSDHNWFSFYASKSK